MHSPQSDLLRPRACSECMALLERHRSAGRPRVTCSFACAGKRARRRARELWVIDMDDAKRWWLSLNEGQRLAAARFARENPPPKGFHAGAQLWAYYCRSSIQCEGKVTPGIR